MNKDKKFISSKFNSIFLYIGYILVVDICFLITISPFIYYILIFTEDNSLKILLFLSLLLGPALTTVFSIVGKLIREKKIEPIKDFIYFYKLNFFQGIVAAILLNTLLLIEYIDKNYCISMGSSTGSYLFLLLMIITTLISFYIYPIISRYSMGIIYAIHLSLRLFIKNIHISFIYLLIIVGGIILINSSKIAIFFIFLMAIFIVYLIMFFQINAIEELKDKIYNKYNK